MAGAVSWTLFPSCPDSSGSVPLYLLARAWEIQAAHNGDLVGLDCPDVGNGGCFLRLWEPFVFLRNCLNYRHTTQTKMDFNSIKSGLVSFTSAFIASLCCLLPLTVVLLGLGSGAFMMVTMQYRYIFLPVGMVGVALGYYLYFREKQRCTSIGCAFVGRKFNLTLLGLATVMLVAELLLVIYPALVSELLQQAM